jgi:hypothetical protein
MTVQRITKRVVDALLSNDREFTLWDDAVSGFGVRVRATGAKSYVVVYRAGAGRGAPVRRYTIAAVGKITPERARARAKVILGAVAHGHDPANQKTAERGTPTVAELADRFMADHVRPKRKAGTAEFYRDILDRIVKPAMGTTKADKLTRLQVGRLHSSLASTPFQANRVLAVVGSMYAFAGRAGIVPEPRKRLPVTSRQLLKGTKRLPSSRSPAIARAKVKTRAWGLGPHRHVPADICFPVVVEFGLELPMLIGQSLSALPGYFRPQLVPLSRAHRLPRCRDT